MVPDSYSKNQDDRQTQARVMIGIMKGMEIGIPPITALSTIVIINNRPCVWGDGAIALVQKSGNLENFKETMTGTPHEDDWTATCEVQRKGLIDPIIREFTWAQAKKASLTGKKGPWMSYPARMMQMRARAFALRDGFADALYGLGIGEEMRDVPVAKETVDTDFLSDEAPVLPKLEPAMEEMPDDVRETVEAGLDSSVNSNEGEE